MGHFSYSCHLSGLPITGDTKCVLLPILPKKYSYSTKDLQRFGVGSIVSNDGPNVYFNELCFPIFGTYDSYGRLEDIEIDDNTKVLEKFFNLSIADIVECILDSRKDQFKVDQVGEDAKEDKFNLSVTKEKIDFKKYPNQLLLIRASATWYRRDVYDKLITKNRLGKKDWYDKIDLGVPGLLKTLGFIEGETKKQGRFNRPFTKDGLTVYSDGNWLSDKAGEYDGFGVYNLLELKKWCKKKGVNIDISKLKDLSQYGQIFKCLIPNIELEDINSSDRWVSERIIRMLLGDDDTLRSKEMNADYLTCGLNRSIKQREENPENYKDLCKTMRMDVVEYYTTLIKEAEDYGPISGLPFFYFENIKEEGGEFLLKNIEDWYFFKSYYYPTGRFLYPIGTSDQDGDHLKVLELIKVAHDVLKTEIDERRKIGYYDHEEEDEEEIEQD